MAVQRKVKEEKESGYNGYKMKSEKEKGFAKTAGYV